MPLIRRQPMVLNFPGPLRHRPGLAAAAAAVGERGALLALRQQLALDGEAPNPGLHQALQRPGWADEHQALRALIDQVLAAPPQPAPAERPYVPY